MIKARGRGTSWKHIAQMKMKFQVKKKKKDVDIPHACEKSSDPSRNRSAE